MSSSLPTLKANDTIALVCTGNGFKTDTEAKQAQAYIEAKCPVKVIYAKDTYERVTPQEKADCLLEHLFNDKVAAIWALRGGEGSADIMPLLEPHAVKLKALRPKLLLGFSDFTTILLYFAQRFSWPVVHGPGAWRTYLKELDPITEQTTFDLIMGKQSSIVMDKLLPLNDIAKQSQVIQASLTGGNLSLLQLSAKDSWELEAKDKIVIVEDVDEKPHKAWRTFKYLKRIGLLEGARALLLGDFTSQPIITDSGETAMDNEAMLRILARFAREDCPFPVLMTDRFGHGRHNMPLPFNIPCELKLGKENTLYLPL